MAANAVAAAPPLWTLVEWPAMRWILFALVLAGCGSHADFESGLREKGFSGAALVARKGVILHQAAMGFADEEARLPNTLQTRFRIGSNTKQFTAMAVLLLQEEGKLRTGDSVCLHVPDCPAAWQPVTLEQLLLHSSGIPDYTNFDEFPSVIGTPATTAALVARFRDLPLQFTPGSRWSYTNSGYVLLGYLIERASGQAYGEFLHDRIFAPLQMADTGIEGSGIATGYLRPGLKPVHLDMSEFAAAGALYSTVADLLRWDQALLTGAIASKASLDTMLTAHIACPAGGCLLPSDQGYGYGWFIANPAGRHYIYHWGHIDGYFSSNGFYRAEGLSVIVLTNLETVDAFGLSVQLGALN